MKNLISFMFWHKDCNKTMCHLNEVGTYYTKLISSLVNIKHSTG